MSRHCRGCNGEIRVYDAEGYVKEKGDPCPGLDDSAEVAALRQEHQEALADQRRRLGAAHDETLAELKRVRQAAATEIEALGQRAEAAEWALGEIAKIVPCFDAKGTASERVAKIVQDALQRDHEKLIDSHMQATERLAAVGRVIEAAKGVHSAFQMPDYSYTPDYLYNQNLITEAVRIHIFELFSALAALEAKK